MYLMKMKKYLFFTQKCTSMTYDEYMEAFDIFSDKI